MTEVAEKTAKINRRTANAGLTRCGKALEHLISHERPTNEVRDALSKFNNAFDSLVLKRKEFTSLIENDDEFAKEESWLDDCQNFFLKVDVAAKSYMENVELKGLSQAVFL